MATPDVQGKRKVSDIARHAIAQRPASERRELGCRVGRSRYAEESAVL